MLTSSVKRYEDEHIGPVWFLFTLSRKSITAIILMI